MILRLKILVLMFCVTIHGFGQSAMIKYWIATNQWTPNIEQDYAYPNSPNSFYETYKLDYKNAVNGGAIGYFTEGEIGDKENDLYNKFARIEGYIIAPSSGPYTFYVAGTPDVSFYLSTDENPSAASNVAYTSVSTGYQMWDIHSSQTSSTINLQAGQRYYFMLKYNCPQGAFNANQSFSAAWSGPGFARRVIAGNDMQPYLPFSHSIPPSRNMKTFSGNIGTWINIWISKREPWWEPNPNGGDKIFIDGAYQNIDWQNLRHINDALNQMVEAGIDFLIFDQTNYVGRTDICRSIQTLAALKGLKVAHARDCNDGGANYSGQAVDLAIYNESVLYKPFGISNYLQVDGKYLMVLYDISSAYERELTRTDDIFQKFTYVSADGYAPGRELWGWQLRTEGAVPSKRGMYVSGSTNHWTTNSWMCSINYFDYNFLLAKSQNPKFLIVGSWDDFGERNKWANITTNNEYHKTYNISGKNDSLAFGNRVKQWLTDKPSVVAGGYIQDGAYQVKSLSTGYTIRSEGTISTAGAVTNHHFTNESAYIPGSYLVQNTFIDEIHHYLWFYHLGANEYKIIPAYTSLPLTANIADNNIQLQLPTTAANQIWIAIKNTDGTYSFKNKATNNFIGMVEPQTLNTRITQTQNPTSIKWIIEAKNIIPSNFEECSSIVAEAIETSNGWTYYGIPNSNEYLFAIEHTPVGGNTSNFSAYVKLSKNCDNSAFHTTNTATKEGIFVAGYYWNIIFTAGNANGFVNLRFFPDSLINAQLETEASSFQMASAANHQSPTLYFQTNNILQLPNDLSFDGKGLSEDYLPLIPFQEGTLNGKSFVQFNQINSINNSGGGMLKRVSNEINVLDAAFFEPIATPESGSAASTGGTAILNVRANDLINGGIATSANSILSKVGTWPSGFGFGSMGDIYVLNGTPVGIYTLRYKLCDLSGNCAEAANTVEVMSTVACSVSDTMPVIEKK